MDKHKKYMKIAAYAGIISFILGIPATILPILVAFNIVGGYWLILYMILLLTTVAASIPFYWGFKVLGDETKNSILRIAAYLLILSMLFTILLLALENLNLLTTETLEHLILSVLNLLFDGFTYIILGIGFIKLKEHYGTIALATGALSIIAGLGILTIILAIPSIPILMIVEILGILILFKASGSSMGAIDKFFTKKQAATPDDTVV